MCIRDSSYACLFPSPPSRRYFASAHTLNAKRSRGTIQKVSELFNIKAADLPVSPEHRQILGLVGRRIQDDVVSSGYNWIRPSLWSSVFTSHVLPRGIKVS